MVNDYMRDKVLIKIKETIGIVKFDNAKILIDTDNKLPGYITSKNVVISKVQSCKLYNNKYMIASTQTTKTEIIAPIAVLLFKLLSCKVLFINGKEIRNC